MNPTRLTAVALTLFLATTGFAQDDDLKKWNDFYAERIAQYEVTVTDDSSAKLTLRREPLLSYTNPVRGRDQHGAVFVWMRGGRPELLGTIWSIELANNPAVRRTSHEVHSLSGSPISVECPAVNDPQATRNNAVTWKLAPVGDWSTPNTEKVGPPAATQPRRLIQMRKIASGLEAVSVGRNDTGERTLRLMRTPLMRYKSDDGSVIDGAVFALVLATDPELLVIVEAVDDSVAQGKSQWRILPARFTGTELHLKHGGKEIWSSNAIDYRNQTGPYRLRVGVSDLPK